MPSDRLDIGEAIRALALLVMVLPMVAGRIPALRRHQRRIWLAMALLYVVGGSALLVRRFVILPLVSAE
jgi:hypothetical protein